MGIDGRGFDSANRIESDSVLWRYCQPMGDHNGIERPQLLACQSPIFARAIRLPQLAKISILRTFNGRCVPGAVPPQTRRSTNQYAGTRSSPQLFAQPDGKSLILKDLPVWFLLADCGRLK